MCVITSDTFDCSPLMLHVKRHQSDLKSNQRKRAEASKPAESSVNFRLNVTPLFIAPVKKTKSVHR